MTLNGEMTRSGVVPARRGARAATLAVVVTMAVATGCIMPGEKKGMQNDIFSMQTRVAELERQLSETSKETKVSGETTAKRVAGTQADLDKMSRDIQIVKGEVDALKVGVTTGQMPGVETTEDSVASRLASLAERVEAVEQAQDELMQALKKAGVKTNGRKPDDKGDKGIKSVADLQKAYDAKRYKQVLEEGPKYTKQGKEEERDQARFLVADSYFNLDKIKEAAVKFDEFVESKPGKRYLAAAKIRLGDCFRKLGDADTAKIYYEELIKDFPDSDEAARAKERISELAKDAGAKKG